MSSKVKGRKPEPPAWQGEPLPRGRHRLGREAVRASQRARLIRAMAEVVSAEGYEATTVPKVVAAARVSTNAFYDFFADKTDCFIAVCEEAGEELFTELASYREAPDWLSGLDGALDAYLRWWVEQPAMTIAYLVELPAAGRRGIDEKERQYERFTVLMRWAAERARREQPDLPPLSEVALSTAVLAPTELIAREVRGGRLERVPELRDDLRYLLVKLLADDATAARFL
jgi:AcrR family transcriptional regulator